MVVAVKQEPPIKGDSDVVTVIVDEGYSSPAQCPMPSKKKKKKKEEEEEEKIPPKKQQKRQKTMTTSTKKQGRRRRSHSTSAPSYIVEIKQADEHGIFSNGRLATLKYLDFFLPKKSEMCLEDKKKKKEKELGEHMDEEVDESIYLEHMQKLANISSVGM